MRKFRDIEFVRIAVKSQYHINWLKDFDFLANEICEKRKRIIKFYNYNDFNKKVYILRNLGFTDLRIAKKLNISKRQYFRKKNKGMKNERTKYL